MSYVYTYSRPDGSVFYVGIGSSGTRKRQHLNAAIAGRPDCNPIKRNIINKILKNGELPIISILIDDIDRELAELIEMEYIAKYGRIDLKTGILSNMTGGGDGSYGLSPDTRAPTVSRFVDWVKNIRVIDDAYKKSVSDGLKAYYKENPVSDEKKEHLRNIMLGEKNPFYGKQHSEETKQILREKNIGKIIPDEIRIKMAAAKAGTHQGSENPMFGKRHTNEELEKMSQAMLAYNQRLIENGIPHPNTGKKPSEETLMKLKQKRTCPHCGITGGGSAMNRWHFDNCKNATTDNKE